MLVTMFSGQEIVGAWVSLTVTVKLHIDPDVVVQVTVVVPLSKNEPEAGKQLTAPQPGSAVGVV